MIGINLEQITYKLRDVRLARGHTFLTCHGLHGGLIIDAGAHRCEFSDQMVRLYNATVIAIEPNRSLSASATQHENITLINAALSGEDGEGRLFLGTNPEASTICKDFTENGRGDAEKQITYRGLRSLIDQFKIEKMDLIKLDIEGAEFDLIDSIEEDICKLIRQISIEFHPLNPSSQDMDRINKAIDRLEKLGFYSLRSSKQGFGDVLFVNSTYFNKPSPTFVKLLPFLRKYMELKNRSTGVFSSRGL